MLLVLLNVEVFILFSFGGFVLCSDVNDPHTFMDLYVSTSDP